MSWLEQYRALARYNQWMNRSLYSLAGLLDDVERKRDRGAFFRSIHGTLNHLLLADSVWLVRFTGDPRARAHDETGRPVHIATLAQELFADFDALTRERERLDARTLEFANQLDEARLMSVIVYKTSAGVPQQHALWWAVGHFFNHQTHHRGQLTTLLSQAGVDCGVTDLAAMLRDEASAMPRP